MECSLDPLCFEAESPGTFGQEAHVSFVLQSPLFDEAGIAEQTLWPVGSHELHQTHMAPHNERHGLSKNHHEETCEDPEVLVFGTCQRNNDRNHDQGHESSSSFATSDEGRQTSPAFCGNAKRSSSAFDCDDMEKPVDDKRRRNCIAARECRAKKKRTFQALQLNQRDLEARYSQLQAENESLRNLNSGLQNQLSFFQVHFVFLHVWSYLCKTNGSCYWP
jgi:hypothetical protein